MTPLARSMLLLVCALLSGPGAVRACLAQDSGRAVGGVGLRIGVELVRSCELQADAAAAITCTRPVPYRRSSQGQSVPPQIEALTPPSPQRVQRQDRGASAMPRFETFTF